MKNDKDDVLLIVNVTKELVSNNFNKDGSPIATVADDVILSVMSYSKMGPSKIIHEFQNACQKEFRQIIDTKKNIFKYFKDSERYKIMLYEFSLLRNTR